MLNRINAFFILWLIRERHVQSIDELQSYFNPIFETTRYSREAQEILHILDRLVASGLIVRNKRELSTTTLFEKMMLSLGINLADMLKYTPESIPAQPLFGKPRTLGPNPDIFVLMPFTDELRPVYDDHIKLVATQLNLKASRADDFFSTHAVISDIWDAIYNSRIVIADCTGRNPNVFYEIGIAHTVGRSTILISQSIEDVPFDLRYLRCITYQYNPRGMAKFNDSLRLTLESEKSKLAIGEK